MTVFDRSAAISRQSGWTAHIIGVLDRNGQFARSGKGVFKPGDIRVGMQQDAIEVSVGNSDRGCIETILTGPKTLLDVSQTAVHFNVARKSSDPFEKGQQVNRRKVTPEWEVFD